MEHTWSIDNLERNQNNGMVDKVFYSLRTVHNSHAIEFNDEIILTTGSISDSGFINYEDLNESIVLSWITGSLDVDTLKATNSSSLLNTITDLDNFKLLGLPW